MFHFPLIRTISIISWRLEGGNSFDLREKAANGGDEAHDTLLFYEGEGKGSFPQF